MTNYFLASIDVMLNQNLPITYDDYLPEERHKCNDPFYKPIKYKNTVEYYRELRCIKEHNNKLIIIKSIYKYEQTWLSALPIPIFNIVLRMIEIDYVHPSFDKLQEYDGSYIGNLLNKASPSDFPILSQKMNA